MAVNLETLLSRLSPVFEAQETSTHIRASAAKREKALDIICRYLLEKTGACYVVAAGKTGETSAFIRGSAYSDDPDGSRASRERGNTLPFDGLAGQAGSALCAQPFSGDFREIDGIAMGGTAYPLFDGYQSSGFILLASPGGKHSQDVPAELLSLSRHLIEDITEIVKVNMILHDILKLYIPIARRIGDTVPDGDFEDVDSQLRKISGAINSLYQRHQEVPYSAQAKNDGENFPHLPNSPNSFHSPPPYDLFHSHDSLSPPDSSHSHDSLHPYDSSPLHDSPLHSPPSSSHHSSLRERISHFEEYLADARAAFNDKCEQAMKNILDETATLESKISEINRRLKLEGASAGGGTEITATHEEIGTFKAMVGHLRQSHIGFIPTYGGMEGIIESAITELKPLAMDRGVMVIFDAGAGMLAQDSSGLSKFSGLPGRASYEIPFTFRHRESVLRCILNLVTNSIEAYADQENKEVTLSLDYDEKMIRLHISDNVAGGIPSVEGRDLHGELGRGKAYTTFGKPYGTGLGIFTVHQLVKKHRGKVEISTGSQGTEFILSFPRFSESFNLDEGAEFFLGINKEIMGDELFQRENYQNISERDIATFYEFASNASKCFQAMRRSRNIAMLLGEGKNIWETFSEYWGRFNEPLRQIAARRGGMVIQAQDGRRIEVEPLANRLDYILDLNWGFIHHESGEYGLAEEKFTAALRHVKENSIEEAKLRNNLGMVMLFRHNAQQDDSLAVAAQHEYDNAERIFLGLLNFNPMQESPESLDGKTISALEEFGIVACGRGYCLSALGKYGQSKSVLEQIGLHIGNLLLKYDPNRVAVKAYALNNLSEMHLRDRNFIGAEASAAAALQTAEPAGIKDVAVEALLVLGVSQFESRRGGIEHLERAKIYMEKFGYTPNKFLMQSMEEVYRTLAEVKGAKTAG